MKIALFHPWFYTKGGAEKLILEWLREFNKFWASSLSIRILINLNLIKILG